MCCRLTLKAPSHLVTIAYIVSDNWQKTEGYMVLKNDQRSIALQDITAKYLCKQTSGPFRSADIPSCFRRYFYNGVNFTRSGCSKHC